MYTLKASLMFPSRSGGKISTAYTCRFPLSQFPINQRLACLLTQQMSITVDHLPTKENKLPFSVSVCSKKTKVCHFRFTFAANKQKLSFSVSLVFPMCVWGVYLCVCIDIYSNINNNFYMLPFQAKDRKQKLRQFSLIRFPFAHWAKVSLSSVRLLIKKQIEVICLQTD